jgi:hypothetical protein
VHLGNCWPGNAHEQSGIACLTGQVVSVTVGAVVELYDVGIASRSEAELAVAKYLQAADHLAISAIEPLSAAAVKALGLGLGEVRPRW